MDLKETTVAVPIHRTNGQQPEAVTTVLNSLGNIAIALMAVDGSPASRAAVSVAMQIAGKTPIAVKGLYIVDEKLITNPYANFQKELGFRVEPDSSANLVCLFQRRGNLTLRWLADRCRTEQVPVSTELFFGGVSELVLKNAEEAQLLVLGRRGLGHMADSKHLGRNYRAIARKAKIPLLVGGGKQRRIKRILLAYNNSASSNRALAWAISLQQKLACQVMMLAITENNGRSETRMTSIVEQLNHSMLHDYELIYRTGQPAEQVVSVAAEDQTDLVVMGRDDHKGWIDWLVGNIVERTLRSTDLPVLVA